ncbi:hypothetical protein IWT5_02129 [Secundilactobacillus silagincola]|uniref:Uncharacterized protein n=1 Tax=Secundilactobacillus silagincola TaxID=1714681 RepID=A0A1Z5J4E6_9LACO|nr:hypothetical protein [Secundilactobacillus silagincola]GAX08960.1 hypothetical protein IWT5_02129 [Secundilactobacillus silagincola]
MKKIRMYALALIIALMAFGAFNTNAQAKTKWTKYTPTALRGDWIAKKNSTGKFSDGSKSTYQQDAFIDKKDFATGVVLDYNPKVLTKAYYHHAKGSKYYYVKGSGYGVTVYNKVELSGKKLRFCTYLTLNKKGHTTKAPFGFIKNYSNWLYKQ